MLGWCGQPRSGINGLTIVDVGCPALPVGETCAERRLPARITAVGSDGQRAGETTSNEHGEFSLDLRPGDYHVMATNMSGTPLPSASPINVSVHRDSVTTVTIKFYSGVR